MPNFNFTFPSIGGVDVSLATDWLVQNKTNRVMGKHTQRNKRSFLIIRLTLTGVSPELNSEGL